MATPSMIENYLSQHFDDVAIRRKIMKQYGDSDMPYVGQNEDGETTMLSVFKDKMILRTYQSNGWVRVNYFDEDGYAEGETFDGRWDK